MPNRHRITRIRRPVELANVPLPHPSWGTTGEPAERGTPVSAIEFWTRLGL